MTYTLDASSVLRFLDMEPGGDRVYEILEQHLDGTANALISSLHWGEVVGIFFKRHGIQRASAELRRLEALYLTVITATAHRAEEAAAIKLMCAIPYVDAFGVQLARAADSVLITADFDFKPAETFASNSWQLSQNSSEPR